ncbi:(2Fe-2S)-binding protein [Rhodococcus yananensis]|uniref:(2Fe-2S)-binding protein n=1 Tax=Rhodococcus yananensis TaxID=2879464 RepID=UPI003EC14C7E
MSDAAAVLAAIADTSPYFVVGTGTDPDGTWQPTSTLRDPAVRDPLVAALTARMGAGEPRVAASTLFFGYAARLWSVAVGSVVESGRCVTLSADELLWCDDGGIRLHLTHPRFSDDIVREVLERQLEPLVAAWRDVVAPGLLWGNTAAALVGAGRVVGARADATVAALLEHPLLRDAFDARTGRRRSCCLFYRTPAGGVCGDCPFTNPPSKGSA